MASFFQYSNILRYFRCLERSMEEMEQRHLHFPIFVAALPLPLARGRDSPIMQLAKRMERKPSRFWIRKVRVIDTYRMRCGLALASMTPVWYGPGILTDRSSCIPMQRKPPPNLQCPPLECRVEVNRTKTDLHFWP